MIGDKVEYEVVWDGRRPVAPPAERSVRSSDWARERVAAVKAAKARRLLAGRQARARANHGPGSALLRNRRIWRALKTPRTALDVALGLRLRFGPVSVLLSKARGAGVVDVVGRKGRRLLYVRAAAHAQAINFPPISRKVATE